MKVHNVTIQVVSIMELVIFIVSKVMNIHIPLWCLGSANSSLWCILGIIV